MEQNGIRILNVGFPKVGNTWIGRVLSNALNARFVEYDADGRVIPDSTMADVLERIGGAMPGRNSTGVATVEKTHLLPGGGRHGWKDWNPDALTKVVYLSRDPRDVAVSYFYFTYHNRAYVESGHVRDCGYLERKKFLLAAMTRYHLHRELWAPHVDAVISYEDMWTDPHRAIVALLNGLGVQFEDGHLREAIDHFSWKRQAQGRSPGDALNTSFLRSGVTGSHEKEFDSIDRALAWAAPVLARIFLFLRRISGGRP